MDNNYSDLIRAVSNAQTLKPDWLKRNGAVFSPTHGRGVIQLLLGNFATIQFGDRQETVDFTDCLEAVTSGVLLPPQAGAEPTTSTDIAAIPYKPYRTLAQDWEAQLRHVHVALPRVGQFEPLPAQLAAPLKRTLAAKGIQQLFSHQVTAYNAVRDGEDLVLATDTSSANAGVQSADPGRRTQLWAHNAHDRAEQPTHGRPV